MRFTEITNPEDQLALWRLISDTVWSTFGQQVQKPGSTAPHAVATVTTKASPKRLSNVPAKPKGTTTKKGKPKKAPTVLPPKPLPKPKPLQPTQTQTKQAQTQQYQQLAHHIQQALANKQPATRLPSVSQPEDPKEVAVAPLNNSYGERDKDDLVFHRRENPLKPLRDQKPL